MVLCPYCAERDAETADHIFADFLGGRRTVRACRLCNSTFGGGIEASTLKALGQVMYLLRLCGMPTSKPMVWKRVPLGDDGALFDVDQDLMAQPSKPTIDRDDKGIIGFRGALGHVQRYVKSLAAEGKRAQIVAQGPTTIRPTLVPMSFPTDANTRRVCLKMSCAAATKLELGDVLDLTARRYLQAGVHAELCPVRLDVNLYPALDRQRPRVGHLIYVRASAAERRIYSIVQLFSAFQFCCMLKEDYEGGDRSILATHDPVSHEEVFEEAPPLDFGVPLQHLAGTPSQANRLRLEQLTREVRELYGDNATDGFWPAV